MTRSVTPHSKSPNAAEPHLRPLSCRDSSTDDVAVALDSDEATQLLEGMRTSIDALVGEPSKAEITAALRSLLEHGDVVSHHIPSSHQILHGHRASCLPCQHSSIYNGGGGSSPMSACLKYLPCQSRRMHREHMNGLRNLDGHAEELAHCLQAGARSLARELASPPIDLVLAEAAAAVMQHCRPAVSQEAGKSVREAVPAAVLSYLSKRVRTPANLLQLAALWARCEESCLSTFSCAC